MSLVPGWESQTAELLTFKDLVAAPPTQPPWVVLSERSTEYRQPGSDWWTPGFLKSSLQVHAMLIREEDFEACCSFGLCDFQAAESPFLLTEDATHAPAGVQRHRGIEIESVCFRHTWDNCDGRSLLSPAQSLLLYLGLEQNHADDAALTSWSDPLDVRQVIERQGTPTAPRTQRLRMDLDYLRDYLAARRKCLIVHRWAERIATFSGESLPWTQRPTQTIRHGRIEYESAVDIGDTGHPSLRGTLLECFRVDPAPKPRHFMLATPPSAITFKSADGTPIQYGSPADYLQVISFSRDILKLFSSPERPRWQVSNDSPGQISLCFPRGNALPASDSPHGQIQALLGDLAELEEEYQMVLAPFSQTAAGKPHPEWFNACFMCIPATSLPWHEQLARAHRSAFLALTPLVNLNPLTPGTDPLPPDRLIRPGARGQVAFFDIAKDMRRSLLRDGTRANWFLPEVHPPFNNPNGVGSIGALKGLIRLHAPSESSAVEGALDSLNDLRQANAHAVTPESALRDAGYEDGDYATRFDRLLESVCAALEAIARVARRVGQEKGLVDIPPELSYPESAEQ